jgi:hypothetical protein
MMYAAKNAVFAAAVFGLASIALARAKSSLPTAQDPSAARLEGTEGRIGFNIYRLF